MSAQRPAPAYLSGYPPSVGAVMADPQGRQAVLQRLRAQHACTHAVRTDAALRAYADALRVRFMRRAPPLSQVRFDNRLQWVHNALGTHASVSRVQGQRLVNKREIRVAGIFRTMPDRLLRMIVVHELAHLKEREHDRAFYALCEHMEPQYHQLELDLRLALTLVELTGEPVWPDGAGGATAGITSPL